MVYRDCSPFIYDVLIGVILALSIKEGVFEMNVESYFRRSVLQRQSRAGRPPTFGTISTEELSHPDRRAIAGKVDGRTLRGLIDRDLEDPFHYVGGIAAHYKSKCKF
jgi:hypothetical protein